MKLQLKSKDENFINICADFFGEENISNAPENNVLQDFSGHIKINNVEIKKPFFLRDIVKHLHQDSRSAMKVNEEINFFKNSRELVGQNSVKLTEKETDLFEYLLKSKDAKEEAEIIADIWGYADGVETNALVSMVYKLRKKLKENFGDKIKIENNAGAYFLRIS